MNALTLFVLAAGLVAGTLAQEDICSATLTLDHSTTGSVDITLNKDNPTTSLALGAGELTVELSAKDCDDNEIFTASETVTIANEDKAITLNAVEVYNPDDLAASGVSLAPFITLIEATPSSLNYDETCTIKVTAIDPDSEGNPQYGISVEAFAGGVAGSLAATTDATCPEAISDAGACHDAAAEGEFTLDFDNTNTAGQQSLTLYTVDADGNKGEASHAVSLDPVATITVDTVLWYGPRVQSDSFTLSEDGVSKVNDNGDAYTSIDASFTVKDADLADSDKTETITATAEYQSATQTKTDDAQEDLDDATKEAICGSATESSNEAGTNDDEKDIVFAVAPEYDADNNDFGFLSCVWNIDVKDSKELTQTVSFTVVVTSTESATISGDIPSFKGYYLSGSSAPGETVTVTVLFTDDSTVDKLSGKVTVDGIEYTGTVTAVDPGKWKLEAETVILPSTAGDADLEVEITDSGAPITVSKTFTIVVKSADRRRSEAGVPSTLGFALNYQGGIFSVGLAADSGVTFQAQEEDAAASSAMNVGMLAGVIAGAVVVVLAMVAVVVKRRNASVGPKKSMAMVEIAAVPSKANW